VSLLRPCATSAGFTATPDPPVRIDMAGLKRRLTASGYVVVVDARIILIVRKQVDVSVSGGVWKVDVETSLYDNGKVLVKTIDRDAAEAAYVDLQPHLALAQAKRP
jgi:hypothetical protein